MLTLRNTPTADSDRTRARAKINGLVAGVVNANRPAEASSAPAAVDVVVPHNAPQVLRVTLQGASGPVSFEFGVPPGAAPGTKLRVEVPQQVRERLAAERFQSLLEWARLEGVKQW